MPDITMCAETCEASTRCHRHPDSGTVPNEWRQSWRIGPSGRDCPYWSEALVAEAATLTQWDSRGEFQEGTEYDR